MTARRSPSSIAIASMLVSACSGATTTELFGPVAQESNPTEPGGASSEDGGASGIAGGSGSGGAGSASPAPAPAPAPSPSPSGDAGLDAAKDSGAPPKKSPCTVEKEPNDGPELTEWFDECFEGSLKKGDLDFASIRAPAGAKTMSIEHEETGGDVRYRLLFDGLALATFSRDPPRQIAVFGGAIFSFELTPLGSNTATRSYRLTVRFQ